MKTVKDKKRVKKVIKRRPDKTRTESIKLLLSLKAEIQAVRQDIANLKAYLPEYNN